MDDMDKEHKDAMDEEEEKAKKAKKAQEEDEKKVEAKMAAILKAMDEDDHEKREALVKAAMEEDEKKHEGMGDDDEEKKALKAEVTYLSAAIKQPKIERLTNIYKASKTPEEQIKSFVAEWEKKTPKQLDAELKKTEHLAETVQFDIIPDNPFHFGGTPAPAPVDEPYSASDETFKKIDKMTPDQAFSGSHYQ